MMRLEKSFAAKVRSKSSSSLIFYISYIDSFVVNSDGNMSNIVFLIIDLFALCLQFAVQT